MTRARAREMQRFDSVCDLKMKVAGAVIENYKHAEPSILAIVANMDMSDKKGDVLDTLTDLDTLCGNLGWAEVSFTINAEN